MRYINHNLPILIWSFVLAGTAHAGLFKTTDDNGVTLFTDQPDKALSQGKTIQPLADREISVVPSFKATAPEPASKPKPEKIWYEVSILSPKNETMFKRFNGNINILAKVTPELQNNARLILSVNGEQIAEGASASYDTGKLFRGAHTITASVLDKGEIQTSASATIFIRQHSRLFNKKKKEEEKPWYQRLGINF